MRRTIAIILLLLLLPGCGFRTGVSEEQVTTKRDELERLSESRIVRVHREAYMGARPVSIARTEFSPVFDRTITFNVRGSLSQLAASISGVIGMRSSSNSLRSRSCSLSRAASKPSARIQKVLLLLIFSGTKMMT